MTLFLFYILVFCIGFLSIFLLSNGYKNTSFSILLSISMPFGIGISSLLFFILNTLHVPILLIYFIHVLILSGLLLNIKKKQLNFIPILNIQKKLDDFLKNPLLIVLSAVFFNALLINIFIFIEDNIREPHGIWDAWSYWNLKAKFIARAPFEWQHLFTQMRSVDFHLDYPLLQTGFIAESWLILGNESVLVPMFSAFIYTFSGVFVILSIIKYFSNASWGVLAGLILLSTPFYVTLGDSQYADTTVGFFILLSFIFLALHYKNSENNNFLILTSMACGMAAWSKNEGFLFAFIFIFFLFIIELFYNKKLMFDKLKHIIYGILPIFLVVCFYKTFSTPPNDLIEQSSNTISKMSDWNRYTFIASWFIEYFKNFGKWAFNPWWIFLICGILLGFNISNFKKLFLVSIFSIIFMLIAFFFVYINSYIDLTFHLSTSLHRLYFQLFPSFIFLYMFFIKKINL